MMFKANCDSCGQEFLTGGFAIPKGETTCDGIGLDALQLGEKLVMLATQALEFKCDTCVEKDSCSD